MLANGRLSRAPSRLGGRCVVPAGSLIAQAERGTTPPQTTRKTGFTQARRQARDMEHGFPCFE